MFQSQTTCFLGFDANSLEIPKNTYIVFKPKIPFGGQTKQCSVVLHGFSKNLYLYLYHFLADNILWSLN